MPFMAKANFEAEQEAFRRISAEGASGRRAVMNQIGFYLLAKEKEHFQRLSKTGSSNGVTWQKHSEQTRRRRIALALRGKLPNASPEQIGILTGWMASHFRFRSTSNQVRVTNTAPYAGAFAKARPIYPDTFPADWLAGCDSIVQRHFSNVTGGLSK